VVIVDTAGRLHIDDELMRELIAIRDATDPSDRLFVADAMTGQDAIKSAGEFNARVGVTGVVMTKLDGDARGGAQRDRPHADPSDRDLPGQVSRRTLRGRCLDATARRATASSLTVRRLVRYDKGLR